MFRSTLSVFAILLLSFLLSISWCPQGTVAIYCGKNASHNVYFGRRTAYDSMLHMTRIKVPLKWPRIVSADVHYPSAGDIKGIIHYIEVLDQYTHKNGGCAYMTGGGIDQKSVSFHIKSQRSEGLDFIIRIYGTPTRY